MKIKNITIANLGNIKNEIINIDSNLVLLDKDKLLSILKYFMNIEMIDSIHEMNNLLCPSSTIDIEFIDTENNTICYSATLSNQSFSIGNFTTSSFLTDAFSEHFFPQEYADYTFLDLERGYRNDYIAKCITPLKKQIADSFDERPPHNRLSDEIIAFALEFVNRFEKIQLSKDLYFTVDSNFTFVLQNSNNELVSIGTTNRTLFAILCFIYTNYYFSTLKEYDNEIESAYTPLLIKGNFLGNEKDFIFNLLKEQNRQVFIFM